MTQIYDVVFPAKGRQMFDGGQNNKFERSIIADNESPGCANVVFANGAVETRPGSTKLNTSAIGSFVFDGLYTRRDNTTAETMVAFAGGTMWALTGASTFATIPSAQSVFTAGVRVGTTQYENHMFIGNGGVTPYKYNGSAFTRHGVPAPATTMSVASNGAGNLAGDYRYKVVFVNSAAVFGDVSPATATFTATATGSQLRVSSIPVAPTSHGVSARRLYRTDAGGLTYKFIATISDNSTTQYDDNIASSAAGVAAPTDNGEPPKYSVACQHQGRLFVNDTANPGFVWYSNIFEPYTFGALNFQPIGDQTRDLVKSLDVYDNQILVGCENGMYLLYMPSTDPTDWYVIKIRTSFGTKSPFANFLYQNKIMFAAMQNDKFIGFAAVSGSNIDPEATYLDSSTNESDTKSDKIEQDMFDVQETYVGNISAMVFKNKAYITVTKGNGQTLNNRVYIFDFSRTNFKKQEASWSPVTGLNAAQFTVYGGRLYYGSSTATGFVYQLESAVYADDGAAIDSYFWTKEYSGVSGHENLQKDFRRIKLLVEMAGAYNMNLTYRVDSDKGDGVSQQLDLNPGSTIWNAFNWGSANWGGGSDQKEISVTLGQVSGKRIQLKFSNQNAVNQRFKVHGMNITYNVKGKR